MTAQSDWEEQDLLTIDLAAGPDCATIATTDLTVAYVHENAAYST